MKNSMCTFLKVTCLVFFAAFPGISADCQTKMTTGKEIIYKLNTSVQMTKEQWEFDFSDDYCVFNKSRKYREKDGLLKSTFTIVVPLGDVLIEPELKSYDAFFRCAGGNGCISRDWYDAQGKLVEQRRIDSASLYLKNRDLATEIFNKFTYLRTLCDRSTYPGPSGLEWGTSIEEATSTLKNRFALKTEETTGNGALFSQVYGDDFGGFATDAIRVNYVDNKFYEMVVVLGYDDVNSIAKKWYAVVTKMIDKYGKPNEIVLPKSIAGLDEVIDRKLFKDFKVFDMEIREHRWLPQSTWKYKNNVYITIKVVPKIKDWEIQWRFYHAELIELSKTRLADRPSDDF